MTAGCQDSGNSVRLFEFKMALEALHFYEGLLGGCEWSEKDSFWF
jgi:hypothetical protein